jgi:hypothetical protein
MRKAVCGEKKRLRREGFHFSDGKDQGGGSTEISKDNTH